MEIDSLRRSARCSRLEKIRNNVLREKINLKNSVIYYIRYKDLNWYGHVQRWTKKGCLEDFRMVPTWKTKKGKTSEFLEAGAYNRNERAGNWRLGMGRQRGWRKKINLP